MLCALHFNTLLCNGCISSFVMCEMVVHVKLCLMILFYFINICFFDCNVLASSMYHILMTKLSITRNLAGEISQEFTKRQVGWLMCLSTTIIFLDCKVWIMFIITKGKYSSLTNMLEKIFLSLFWLSARGLNTNYILLMFEYIFDFYD